MDLIVPALAAKLVNVPNVMRPTTARDALRSGMVIPCLLMIQDLDGTTMRYQGDLAISLSRPVDMHFT